MTLPRLQFNWLTGNAGGTDQWREVPCAEPCMLLRTGLQLRRPTKNSLAEKGTGLPADGQAKERENQNTMK